ncbi:unnamed protein product [Thlaspi arvense]|uniref:FAS1 domain-containing protein n=1 Tax=Thlaspi arvense TaxID=13288 RepID=A0AAU9T2V1_THLAR|nr:unnamed protein product [Thlaspi arvense]
MGFGITSSSSVIGLLLLSTITLALAVDVSSRSAEDTAQEIISSLAHAKYQEWSAAFISTNDKIRGGVLPATLFVPAAATDEYNGDRRVAAYRVVPEKMVFSDLLAKTNQSRIRTLLGGFSILLYNTSKGGLTLDGVSITEPDMYVDSFKAIHRIAHPLHFTTPEDPKVKSEVPVLAFVLVTVVVCTISWICITRR